MSSEGDLLAPYVPRLAVTWLRETPEALWREVEGSLAFVDISGFTALTEKLARKGKVGAEEMSDILNATFADLLEVAYADGAGLVKWGGDAVLLLFDGDDHAARAARASFRMRARLQQIGKVSTGSGRVTLRMSIGIHSGTFHFFLVGDPALHRELLISGPAASRTAEMEAFADADEIGLSPQTAALLDPALVGEPKGEALLLAGEPSLPPGIPVPRPSQEGVDIGGLIPTAIRQHLLSASGEPEHRRIAVAFVQFSGTDELLATEGPQVLADALDEAIRNVQEATDRHGVTFFETDINRDGGKIMLTAGAPFSADHDEERMLRATRSIVERIGRLPLRIGVNAGPVFAGDFGPTFRRTFSVKGDAINLAARVMGKAGQGQLLATLAVLERSPTRFDVEPLPPFTVKGKSILVEAASVGRRLTGRGADSQAAPLVGREVELGLLAGALAEARAGHGRMVDLAGEPGIGKSRLVQEVIRLAALPSYLARCDEYETATAYWPFRSLLRELIGAPPEASDDAVIETLRQVAERRHPASVPWLPLIGRVLDVDIPSTPQVHAITEQFRRDRLEVVTAAFVAALLPDPTVLVFDDVHLMDEASSGLLERLCDGLGGRPWLVLVTRRDVDDGFAPSQAYEVVPLRPAPLDDVAATALVEQELRDSPLPPHDVAALIVRAGGNPLFLRGLVLAARSGASLDDLPATVEALITSQIDRLPPDERTLLRFASVLGVGFHESELRAVMHGHPLPTGREALRRLSVFIRQEGHGRYRFDHQLIRDTAYEGLPYRLRRDLHGRAGEIIEASAVDTDDVAELLSLHYFHAARPEKAWRYSRSAGERASGKYAYAQAEELLARALVTARSLPALPDDDVASVALELGEARFRLGRNTLAIEAFRVARARLRGQPQRAALVLKREAETDLRRGRFPVALRTLTRGMRLLDDDTDAGSLVVRSRLEGVYAVVREHQGRYRDALAWARRAEEHAAGSGDPAALADSLIAVHGALSMLGSEPDRPYGELALGLYEQLGDRVGQSRALNNLAVLAWIQGRGTEALEMFTRAEVLAGEAGDTVGAAATRYNVGDVLLRLGRAQEAETLLRALVPVLASLGLADFCAAAQRAHGVALVLEGRREEGRALLDDARATLDRLGEAAEVVETDAAIALAMLFEGDHEGALAQASAAAARATALDMGYLLPWVRRLEGGALSDGGRLDEAGEVLATALALAETQSRVELGFVLAELARVARRRGDLEGAARLGAQSGVAFDLLGFVGDPRYPHPHAEAGRRSGRPQPCDRAASGYGRSLGSSTNSTGRVSAPVKELPAREMA